MEYTTEGLCYGSGSDSFILQVRSVVTLGTLGGLMECGVHVHARVRSCCWFLFFVARCESVEQYISLPIQVGSTPSCGLSETLRRGSLQAPLNAILHFGIALVVAVQSRLEIDCEK